MDQLKNIIKEFKKDIKCIECLDKVSNNTIFTKDEIEELYNSIDEFNEIEAIQDMLTKEIPNQQEVIDFCGALQEKAAMLRYMFGLVEKLTDKFFDNYLKRLEIASSHNFEIQEKNLREFYNEQVILQGSTKNLIITQLILRHQYTFGLTIFDTNLKKIKNILVRENFGARELYRRFGNEHELLAFDEENRVFTYIDILNATHHTIPLNTISDDVYFTRYYHWVEAVLTILSSKGQAYKLNVKTGIISQVSIDSVKKYFPFLDDFEDIPSDRDLCPINMEQSQYIFKDWDNAQYEFIDYKKNERFVIDFFDDESYQYLYKNGLLVIVCENQIVIFKDKKQTAVVKTNIPHAILGASFLENASKLVVVVDNQNSSIQRMYIYEITSK